ncbi:MAG: hypothetical protein ABIQ04_02410 [Candidatus Saccharimonadales bacterium]
MTDKPKISHYAQTDVYETKSFKLSDADRSNLTALYPKPKTYAQREMDDKLRQKSFRRKWPKYPALNIAVYGSVLFGLIIRFAQSLNVWWFSNPSDSGATMSIVFFSFILGLGLVFLIIAWVGFVNRQFSYFGGLLRLFWLTYGVIIAIMVGLWLSSWIGNYTYILWVPSLAVLHFIIVLISAKHILGRASDTE